MGSRYLITGAQMGLLIALSKTDNNRTLAHLREIYENQYLGKSTRHISQDIKEIKTLFYPKKVSEFSS